MHNSKKINVVSEIPVMSNNSDNHFFGTDADMPNCPERISDTNNKFDADTLAQLDHLFDIVDKVRYSYFWEGGNKSERSYKEKNTAFQK